MVKNIILHGSPGTGKTLMLVEVLRIKVGQFIAEKRPFKIILATYLDYATELRKDFKHRLNIECFLREFANGAATMENLGKG